MFKDYYTILDIRQDASLSDIKKAYKLQALRWHPDKNQGTNTTKKMQNINEAYLILSDSDARSRYDQEYNNYKQEFSKTTYSDGFSARDDYEIRDEVLNEWINKARRESIALARQAIRDISGMTVVAYKAALDKAKYWILAYLVVQIIFLMLKILD